MLKLDFTLALRNTFATKMRSLLAVLGIAIGTASVLALLSLGQLATDSAIKAFRQLGSQVLSIHWMRADHPIDNRSFIDLFAKRYPDLIEALPIVKLHPSVHYQHKTLNSQVVASTQSLAPVGKLQLQKGRLLQEGDEGIHHCVIGVHVAKAMVLASALPPIGQLLRLGDHYYEVVGVLEPWESRLFLNLMVDNMVLIPFETAINDWHVHTIEDLLLRFDDQVDMLKREARVQSDLSQLSPHHRYFVQSPQALIHQISDQQKRFRWLLAITGGIALLVGGIGIMNFMLVVVSERREEIGIRMAIGARPFNIGRMFLLEALVLSLLGASMGLVLGEVMTYALAHLADWPFHLLWWPPLIGVVVSICTGVFFGFYPALMASRLPPYQALRY